jgi:hypothetical protein
MKLDLGLQPQSGNDDVSNEVNAGCRCLTSARAEYFLLWAIRTSRSAGSRDDGTYCPERTRIRRLKYLLLMTSMILTIMRQDKLPLAHTKPWRKLGSGCKFPYDSDSATSEWDDCITFIHDIAVGDNLIKVEFAVDDHCLCYPPPECYHVVTCCSAALSTAPTISLGMLRNGLWLETKVSTARLVPMALAALICLSCQCGNRTWSSCVLR